MRYVVAFLAVVLLIGCATSTDTAVLGGVLAAAGYGATDPNQAAALLAIGDATVVASKNQAAVEAATAGRTEITVNTSPTTPPSQAHRDTQGIEINTQQTRTCYTCNVARWDKTWHPMGIKTRFLRNEPITAVLDLTTSLPTSEYQVELSVRDRSGRTIAMQSGKSTIAAYAWTWDTWALVGEFSVYWYLNGNAVATCEFSVL